jgi:uncharacterized protein YbjT (DUF2867 family)
MPHDTVAITGVLGFVASHLLPHLERRGARVIGIVRPGRDASRLERLGVEIRTGDLDRPGSLNGVFDGAGTVIHLSGMSQVPGMMPAVERAGVSRGVFVSSAGVYTRLDSVAAAAKRAGEDAVRSSSLAFTILRPSMIYGTIADRNMVRLLKWIRTCPVLAIPGGGTTLQQPVHVDDLVAAILAALDRPEAARREYDVGGPEALPLREVIRLAGAAVGRRARVIGIPVAPAYATARWLRRLGLPSPVRPEQILRLNESKAVDIAPARRDLGFDPRSFAVGIESEARQLLESDGAGPNGGK